ncbi:hypothetical protein JOC69_001166 [Heliobacterium gestii]|nr:hypothetical protein [Heliomicrobium gestii]
MTSWINMDLVLLAVAITGLLFALMQPAPR